MTYKLIKGSLLSFLLSLTILIPSFAVPGVQYYISDFSGEYVYYSDKTFKTDSIVGFLYYDDTTYAARYYSAADNNAKSPERDITIYVNINPEKTHLELTGERIVGATDTFEDTQVVNYLHDLLYEFTECRQKQQINSCEPVQSQQTFDQFGGFVTITYNSLIPIFNIQSIASADKTKIFDVLTTGILTSSSDASFTNFKGVNSDIKDKARKFKKKRAKALTVEFEGQKIKIDSQWSQSMENLWLLGDSALLTINTVSVPEAYKNSKEQFHDVLLRKLSQSTEGSYSLWQKRSLKSNDGKDSIINMFYQPETGDLTRDFKIIQDMGNGTYAYLTMTVFESIYQKNKSYFNKIIKSHSLTN
ncbi:MAG: hypothetical protein K6G00_08565 [Treponema sp.]|nr:hypothetical protein [Treponema sp.]